MDNVIFDKKLDCCSVMKCMKIFEYLKIVDKVYEKKGGIQGQRDALKQKTAINIRDRMVADITEGTILPPLVIGIIVDDDEYQKIEGEKINSDNILDFINSLDIANISIIDGMQRTTAIKKALDANKEVNDNPIRVEFWISKNVNSLIYRMLVLNTGQVPWNIRRQIEIVFGGIISAIKKQVDYISIIEIDKNKRRKKGGEYNANDLVEMFLAFGARTWKINTKEKLTDEFTRGDFVQSSSETDVVDSFCKILSLMAEFDIKLDNKIIKETAKNGKYNIGRDLFSSAPAKIGFAAACGVSILGRPGTANLNKDKIDANTEHVVKSIKTVLTKIDETENVNEFMDFETLSIMTDKKTSKIGDYERELFYSAFKTLIDEEGHIDSFTVCWRTM